MAGETVLVVDDRQDSIDFLREYVLRPNGYQVLTARDGEEGLRLALEARPDLLITDLMMPRRTGLEILEELHERKIDLPVILMTFHGSEATAIRAFRLGARDYIIKPFSVNEMIAAIGRALAEARLRRERDQLSQKLIDANKQLGRRIKELQALYGIGHSVTSLPDLEQVLNRIVEAAVYIISAEEGLLLLVDGATGELHMRAAKGLDEHQAKGFRVRAQDSIVGRVMSTGKPVVLGGLGQDKSFKFKTDHFVKASLGVPLKIGDEVIGVLAVNNKTRSQPFGQGDQYLLSALADYACVAIENARLRDDLATSERLTQTEKLASLELMAARVAQKIETPIQAILSHVRVLYNQMEPNNLLLKALNSIEREVLRCRRTTTNLLNFSQRTPLDVHPTDLNNVLGAAADVVAREAGPARVEVVKGLDPELPPVPADEKQLQQAFANLIHNAYEAMPQGGVLRLFTRLVGREVQVVIADSGVGIKPQDMPHIFEPFFTTKDPAQNAGLGLTISYGIVERHQGTVEVESQPGVGSTVTVRLPIIAEKETEAARNSTLPQPRTVT